MFGRAHLGSIAALAVLIALAMPLLPNPFYFNVAILIGLNAIVCVGLNLLIGYAGQISLGHAGFFGLGAYTSAILTANHDWPPLAALLIGAVLVGVLSFVIARPILKLKGHYLAMATLGTGIIISIVLSHEVDLTGGPDGMPVPAFSVFGWKLISNEAWYWTIAGCLLFAVWLAHNIIDSPIGRALRSIHGAEIAAQAVGVDTIRYKVLIFVISAMMASVTGSLYAHYSGFITPVEAEFFRSIEFVTMVVLGGMASIYGSIIGAAILTILPQALTVFQDYETLVFGAMLMGVMIFMPRGLWPTLTGPLADHVRDRVRGTRR
ncbi:MAG: branched-chain amino acid ABC transporter permease [Rhodospirillales bacterium]|nr:branched-chain amino acid ABC transporter permease [Rhodospirillales bacterium]